MGIKTACIFAATWMSAYGLIIAAQGHVFDIFKKDAAGYEEIIDEIQGSFHSAKDRARLFFMDGSPGDKEKAFQSIGECLEKINRLTHAQKNDGEIAQKLGAVKTDVSAWLSHFGAYTRRAFEKAGLESDIKQRLAGIKARLRDIPFESNRNALERATDAALKVFLSRKAGEVRWEESKKEMDLSQAAFASWARYARRTSLQERARQDLARFQAFREGVSDFHLKTLEQEKNRADMEEREKKISRAFLEIVKLDQLEKFLESANAILLKYMAAFFVLGMAFFMFAARKWLTAPIRRLEKSARQLAAGNLDSEIDTRRGDELGSLAKSMDAMRVRIRNHVRDMESKNEKMRRLTEKIHFSRLNAMEDMGAGVSHEINQPLTIIKLRTERLLHDLSRDCFVEEKEYEAFHRAMEKNIFQVSRVDEVIKKMSLLTRDDPDPRGAFDARKPLEWALSLFRERLKRNGIVLETDIKDGLPPVAATPRALRIVCLSLISNARFAVNEKAKAVPGHRKKITARLYRDENRRRPALEIADNGVGMSREARDRCLEPFFTTREVNEGMGMGLFIAYRVAKESGMKIEIESEANRGSVFRILMPAAKGA